MPEGAVPGEQNGDRSALSGTVGELLFADMCEGVVHGFCIVRMLSCLAFECVTAAGCQRWLRRLCHEDVMLMLFSSMK